VYNTDVKGTNGIVNVTLEYNEKDLPKNPVLVDANGNRVAAQFTQPKFVKKFKLPYDSFRVVYDTYEMQVEFTADMKDSLSAATYYVQDGESANASALVATADTCENAYVRLTFHKDGTFTLLNKASGATYNNQNRFEITPDSGNEYDFKPAGETRILNDDTATVTLAEATSFKAVYNICVGADGIKLCSTVTVYANRKEIHFTTRVENRLTNVRLRATFESNPTAKYVYAEGQFDLIRRNIQPVESWINPDNSQRMNTFCVVGKDEGEGLLVATKGLYEYEVYRDGKNTMGITLLRAIGEMGDWFYFPTPAAQMQGEYEYSYCLIPFDGDFEAAATNGYNFSYPKLCALQADKHDGAEALKGVNVTTEGTLLTSAVKKAEAYNSVVVRMYNPLQDTARIASKQVFRKTNLAENVDENLANDCEVSSKKIVTIKF
jgi:alpha-mannosidase